MVSPDARQRPADVGWPLPVAEPLGKRVRDGLVAAVRRAPTWLGLAMIVAAVAGCGGSGVHAQTGPSTSAPTSSTATGTATAQTEQQRAAAAAIAQVIAYEQVLAQLANDPSMSLDALYAVSTQPDVNDEIGFLNHFRAAHDRQVGSPNVVSTKVESADLTAASASGSGDPTVGIFACIDVSKVQAFGPDGKSIVPATRKPYYHTHLLLVNHKYPDPQGWLVEKVTATEESSCAD